MKKLFYVIAFSAIAGFVLSSCVGTANKMDTFRGSAYEKKGGGKRKAMSPLVKKGWAYLERVHSESSEIKCEGYEAFPKEEVQRMKEGFNLKELSNVVTFYVRGFNTYGVEIQDTLHVFYKNEIPVCFLSNEELSDAAAGDMYGKLRIYAKLKAGGLMN